MKMTVVVIVASSLLASSQAAVAETHYMFCFGGGRAATYFSGVFSVPEETRSKDKEPAFNAFVKSKYGTMIHAECHRDQTKASSESAKKLQEDSLRSAKPAPFNVVETGWGG